MRTPASSRSLWFSRRVAPLRRAGVALAAVALLTCSALPGALAVDGTGDVPSVAVQPADPAKNDPNDALATAIAGLGHCGLRAVRVEDHTAVIRMVIDRYDDLVALRTQAVCRLHVGLRELIAGGAPRRLGAERAAKKFGEEAVEAVIEAVRGDRERLVEEAADTLYHLLVMLASRDVTLSEV